MKRAFLILSIIIFFFFMTGVILNPHFSDWEKKKAGGYYIEKGFEETKSANVVSSIVWDFRSLDTLGEETVLFTAAVGVFTVVVFGFKIRKMV
jgi:multicomponent Na+:H+ antiporter subunit B